MDAQDIKVELVNVKKEETLKDIDVLLLKPLDEWSHLEL
jgi:hypothetical protein